MIDSSLFSSDLDQITLTNKVIRKSFRNLTTQKKIKQKKKGKSGEKKKKIFFSLSLRIKLNLAVVV
ncbi:MAG: hypothetical protein M5E90_08335 [Asgard group archaeon]|nr:hypothetical protein [Asgard group archaeon]